MQIIYKINLLIRINSLQAFFAGRSEDNSSVEPCETLNLNMTASSGGDKGHGSKGPKKQRAAKLARDQSYKLNIFVLADASLNVFKFRV